MIDLILTCSFNQSAQEVMLRTVSTDKEQWQMEDDHTWSNIKKIYTYRR